MKNTPRKATLNLDLSLLYMSVVLEFAEGCGRAFGFTEEDTARIRLACEEVFGYLCHVRKSGSEVTIEARNGIHQMEVAFLFQPHSFDPYTFNLTAIVKPEEGQMDDIGLVIASRSIDRLSIRHGQLDDLALVLTKEKSYPPWQTSQPIQVAPFKDFILTKPDGEMVKRLSTNGVAYYDDSCFPSIFRSPARMADLVSAGDYDVLVASGKGLQGGEVGGGIVWQRVGRAMVEFYGPYLFGQSSRQEIAHSLMDSFLAAIARTDASGTFCRYTTPDLPGQYLELLGSIEYRVNKDITQTNRFFYRQLREDEGSHVWADQQLIPFLKEVYQRLFLPREIMAATFDGEMRGPHSVLSVEFDRARDSATVRPLWDGADGAQNIAGHLRIFREENLENIFFELDLGSPWQARLAPALFDNGFRPVLLLPYAGQSDLVVFHRDR